MTKTITVQTEDQLVLGRFRRCCTQQMREAYSAYLRSNVETLGGVYKSYSDAKRKAYKHCRELCKAMNGYSFAIVSVSSHFFTVGWYFNHEGDRCFAWVTRDNLRWCPVANLV